MSPFDEGYSSAKKGEASDSNPYVSESRNWHNWMSGYFTCVADTQEVYE